MVVTYAAPMQRAMNRPARSRNQCLGPALQRHCSRGDGSRQRTEQSTCPDLDSHPPNQPLTLLRVELADRIIAVIRGVLDERFDETKKDRDDDRCLDGLSERLRTVFGGLARRINSGWKLGRPHDDEDGDTAAETGSGEQDPRRQTSFSCILGRRRT